MRLPAFAYEVPRNLHDALEILKTYGPECKILAGGTDLLVRMKQGLTKPAHLVSLKNLAELTILEESEGMLRIGAAVSLDDILQFKPIQERWPGLYEAIKAVGAPSIQHFRGTIGGNLCQENRCQFYNQSNLFRGARQSCNKTGGRTCFAWEGGSDRCHSINQSDAAPVLMAMNAQVIIQSHQGTRTMPLSEMYSGIGEHPLSLNDDELLVEIQVPVPEPSTGAAFEKLAYRSAIDYAVVSAGAFVKLADKKFVDARLVIGAVSRGPLLISTIEEILKNKEVNDIEALEKAGESAMNTAGAFIANNVSQPAAYRIQMVAVLAKRAIRKAAQRALSGAEGEGK